PETAKVLGLTVDSTITIQVFAGNIPPAEAATRNMTLHVVGLFEVATQNDPFWHKEDFQLGQEDPTLPPIYKALLSNDTLLHVIGQIPTVAGGGGHLVYAVPPDLFWYYRLDVSRIDANKIDDVVTGLSTALNE